jgi:hypothetical protein
VEEMNDQIQFSYPHALVEVTDLEPYISIIKDELAQMKQAFDQPYFDDRCSINLPFDETLIRQVHVLV